MLPREIVWENGVTYEIDKVLQITQAAAMRAGGQGDRYKIRVRGKESYISRLGNNMNQIARHLNQGGTITQPVFEDIEQELTKLDLSIDNFNRAVEKEYGSN